MTTALETGAADGMVGVIGAEATGGLGAGGGCEGALAAGIETGGGAAGAGAGAGVGVGLADATGCGMGEGAENGRGAETTGCGEGALPTGGMTTGAGFVTG